MGISINIARQLARITPLLEGKKNGIMLGRQKMHFRPEWQPRLINELAKMGIQTTEQEIFRETTFVNHISMQSTGPPLPVWIFQTLKALSIFTI